MQDLRRQLEDWRAHFDNLGFDTMEFSFEEPATEMDIAALEKRLGVTVPPSLRIVLLEISREVEFSWFKPDEHEFPEPFDEIFCGNLDWSMELIQQAEDGRKGWIESCFSNLENDYDAVWHNKLAFMEVGNGDYLAIDLTPEQYEQIVYLSHDGGDGHGCVLAENFLDLLRRWAPLACPGAEDWQWLPFYEGSPARIQPDGAVAKRWLQMLGVQPE